MSLKKVEQVKRDKGFKLADLIIYGAIVIIIAVVFIVTFAVRGGTLRGVRIKVYGTAVFACSFENGTYSAFTEDDSIEFTKIEDGRQLVTVKGEQGYNVVEINYVNRTVKVVEADCRHGDCIYSNLHPTQIITSNQSLPIYCNPHALIIEPLDYSRNYDNPNITI